MLEVTQVLFWLGFGGCLAVAALLVFVTVFNALSHDYFLELDPQWGFWFFLVFSVVCMYVGSQLMLPN